MAIDKTIFFTFCAGLVVIALSGCGEERPAERTDKTATEATEVAKKAEEAREEVGKKGEEEGDPEKGKETYAVFCASCHGITGKGDGPAAAALPVKPTNLTDGEDLNAEPDEFLFKIIKEGGASVGKSPLMAPWGGQLKDEEIWNLVSYIRTLAVPPYKPAQ